MPELKEKITPGEWRATPAAAGGIAIISGYRYGHGDPETLATVGQLAPAPEDRLEVLADAAVMTNAGNFHHALEAIAAIDEGDPAAVHQAVQMARVALKAAQEEFRKLLAPQ